MRVQKQTRADASIATCIREHRSFSVVAGAGSGKTTSLVEALRVIRRSVEVRLRRDGQRVLCITYTNRAVDVISSKVGWDELFAVSTLHSFLWGEVKQFTSEICSTLHDCIIPARIQKYRESADGGKSKKAAEAREKIEALALQLDALLHVPKFRRSDTQFSDYESGSLGHDDVVLVATDMISKSASLRGLIGQRYPFILVDEAQDTPASVVDALNLICEGEGLPLVGYFGDPMQQIYDGTAGDFSGPPGSEVITKEENFRSSREVVKLLNAFREDVTQVPSGHNAQVAGSVQVRLVKAEDPEGPRRRYTLEQTERASQRFDEALAGWGWAEDVEVKQLFLVRQMIARRAGFSVVHALFTGPYASNKAKDEYESGTHFLLLPFVNSLLTLVLAQRAADQRLVVDTLRQHSPTFEPDGRNSTRTLADMIALAARATDGLVKQWRDGTIADVLKYCRSEGLCTMSERLVEHLERKPRSEEYDKDAHSDEKGDWLADEFLKMPTHELEQFVEFQKENTPLSTQHGVKGEQYKNVVIVFDDVEAGWHNYNFAKMLTPGTSGKGTDGQLARSRKLAYVCFSRAEENLRVLLFTPDPESAKDELIARNLFTEGQVEIAPLP